MSSKAIFLCILVTLIIIRDPGIVTTLINGILNLFQVNPNG